MDAQENFIKKLNSKDKFLREKLKFDLCDFSQNKN